MPAAHDEIRDLAQTFNGMLTRLETAFGSLRQFTADASHELRSPVALILAEAEIALRRERPVEGYREALRKIMLEAQSTASLVEDLLLLARGDAGKSTPPTEPVDLATVVRDVWPVGSGGIRPPRDESACRRAARPRLFTCRDAPRSFAGLWWR